MHRTLTALIAHCLLFSAVATAADQIDLRPKLPAGDLYMEYSVEASQKLNGPDGKPMEVLTQSLYGLLGEITAEGESARISAALDRLSGMMSFGAGIRNSYDTDDSENEEASPDYRSAFTPILNMPLAISVDRAAKPTVKDGAAAIREKLTALGQQNFVANSLATEDFTDPQVGSQFGVTPFVLYPHRTVKVGETWKIETTDLYPQIGAVLVTYDCKLEKIESTAAGDVAMIAYTGKITKDPSEKAPEGRPLGKIDGTFTGKAVFSAALGRFTAIERNTQAAIEMPSWFTRDPAAPMMKIDASLKHSYTATAAADRKQTKDRIAAEVQKTRAARAAEEAAAMAGPELPMTKPNDPQPWLQWGGPDRNFRSAATGLANRWPADGPRKLWERPLGDGFSAVLCDGPTAYTTYSVRNAQNPLEGEEIVVALNATTGETLWEHRYSVPWDKSLQMEFGPGPHSTPLLIGDRLFTVGCTAKLLCLDKRTGKVQWARDLHGEFKAGLHMRGYGSSPIEHNGAVVLPVSDDKDHALMAFAAEDGAIVWKGGDFKPGYASLLSINVGGKDQFAAFTATGLIGVDPATRETLWSIDHPTQFGANISTPLWDPADQLFFISSAYGMGSRGVKIEYGGGKFQASEAWSSNKIKVQHGNVVRTGEWIFASSGDFGPAFLACINARSGDIAWRQRGLAKATLLLADDKLILLDEEGTLALVSADSKRYRLLAKAPGVLAKTAWTVPTLYGRTLFVRDRSKIAALDLGAQ